LDAPEGGFGFNYLQFHIQKKHATALTAKTSIVTAKIASSAVNFALRRAGGAGLTKRVCARRGASLGSVGSAKVVFRFMFMVVIFAGRMQRNADLDSKNPPAT